MIHELKFSGDGAERPPLVVSVDAHGQYIDLVAMNGRGQIGSVTLKYTDAGLVVHAEDWTTPHEPGTVGPSQPIPDTVIVEGAGEAAPLEPWGEVLGPRVRAELHPDSHTMKAEFDASPWLTQASDDEIRAAAAGSWGDSYETDAIAQFFSERDPGVAAVYAYLAANPKMPYSKDTQGSVCTVNEDDVIAWLKANRPALHDELTGELDDAAAAE